MVPLDLQPKCDGCNAKFSVTHALTCAKGGLVLARHDDVNKEWGALGAKALTKSSVTYEPSIYSGRAGRQVRAEAADGTATGERGNHTAPSEARGDVAIHGFWKCGVTAIFDGRISCLDCPTYRGKHPDKVLQDAEKAKKKKYLDACLERRRTFTPMVYSADGMPGDEAEAAEKKMASLLAIAWEREYSEMCRFVRARMALALARNNTHMLRSARDHEGRLIKRPVMEDGAGMELLCQRADG
eukprot:15330321-Ditylum_brightwellii.AAC.1